MGAPRWRSDDASEGEEQHSHDRLGVASYNTSTRGMKDTKCIFLHRNSTPADQDPLGHSRRLPSSLLRVELAADPAELQVKPDLKKPKLSGSDSSDRAQEHYDSDTSDDMTAEDWDKYIAQVRASDGFDVDDVTTEVIGLIHPIDDLYARGPILIESLSSLSRTAIDWYNSQNVFDKLVKANMTAVSGAIYYITFEAEDAGAGLANTFQARVFEGGPEADGTPNVEVELCRIKPFSSTSSCHLKTIRFLVWEDEVYDGTGETGDDGNDTGSGRAEVDDEEGPM
ncbi:hypothetical protein RJ639_023511 [Escallonia herrerae]|uniref:Cystatin domain-containing protein n=1 Tax=Escallonia herrerae TaxID=1293975 RepID=A0AA89ADD5_9ASTE|nr:hypothetical protein RJ639_023511 [Escallonia herrerae]